MAKTLAEATKNTSQNLVEYYNSIERIGFMRKREAVIGTELLKITFRGLCRNYEKEVTATICKVGYSDETKAAEKKYNVSGIITNRVSINNELGYRSFGSYSFVDTAKLQRRAIMFMCELQDKMICRNENDYPSGRVIIQNNFHHNVNGELINDYFDYTIKEMPSEEKIKELQEKYQLTIIKIERNEELNKKYTLQKNKEEKNKNKRKKDWNAFIEGEVNSFDPRKYNKKQKIA